jgi:AcrR family transcriptional regulator
MSEENKKPLNRDAERSREAILDAAEQLFALKGYEETSLQEIGQLAGVSRGTPTYFFGSKEQLYSAVLDRVIQAEHDFTLRLNPGLEAAAGNPEALIAATVSGFLDFLHERPTFVKLLEREALSGGRFLRGKSGLLTVLSEGMSLINSEIKNEATSQLDAVHFLISFIALCWFPLAHNDTIIHALGLEASDPSFLEQRKKHVTNLILRGFLS